MYLLAGIDTEGDNQWDPAARANQTFANIYAFHRLHAGSAAADGVRHQTQAGSEPAEYDFENK